MRNGKLVLLFLNQNICCGYLNGLLNDTVLLKTKSTLFNLLISETSQFLCYEIVLNMTYVTYKNAFFREMQFWSHCYAVVSYQALFRLSVYTIPAVYLSGAKKCVFLHDTRLWFADYECLLISSLPGKALRTLVDIARLVNLMSKGANLAFYLSAYQVTNEYDVIIDFCIDSKPLATSFKNCNVIMT